MTTMIRTTTTITDIRASLSIIANNVQAGGTMKAGKEDLTSIESIILGYTDTETRRLYNSSHLERSKAGFIRCLFALSARFKDLEVELRTAGEQAMTEMIQDLQHEDDNIIDSIRENSMKASKVESKEATEIKEGKEKAKKAERVIKMYEDLEILADTIKLELDNAQKSFLVVGRCLHDANERIKSNDGKQADFLKWALERCDVRKAQAYKLIKVYKDFGDSTEFAGVSMRVLYALTGSSEEILEKAKKLALKGELDTQAVEGLLMAYQPAPKASPTTAGKPVLKGTATTPEGKDSTKELDKLDKEIDTLDKVIEIKNETIEADSKTITALQDTIESLNETILNLQAELARARSSKPASLPALPQFDSKSPATVIGLEVEYSKDKAKVNKAYRALAKIYTATACPESAKKILDARTALLDAIK